MMDFMLPDNKEQLKRALACLAEADTLASGQRRLELLTEACTRMTTCLFLIILRDVGFFDEDDEDADRSVEQDKKSA
jgi:hypothetical protein